MKATTAILFIWLFFIPLLKAVETIRLAVVPEDSESRVAADLLTVPLSGEKEIILLERAQIDTVLREQELAAGNRDYVKLGQVLGADGLLIVRLSKATDVQLLSVRLVAVKPGVILAQYEYPWPLNNPRPWTSLVVGQFEPFFPKLTVLPKDAVPISIVNLHSVVASPESEALEQKVTILLNNRLVREKEIFVLERRRMELLSREKEWNGSAENTFWNGSYLLEGTIDKAGISRTEVTLDVQLTPPDKKGVISLEISGARTNVPAVMNDLALQILTALKKKSTAPAWNSAAEAERYFEEVKWMFKWGMFEEAKSACETSWALGKQTPEVAELRIRSYQACAGPPGTCVIAGDRVAFGELVNLHVFDPSQIATYASVPNAEKFDDIVHAAALYSDGFHIFVRQQPELDPSWIGLGSEILDRCSEWLRYYYFTAEARLGQESRISEAKQRCREIAAMIENHPGFAHADTNHLLLQTTAGRFSFWVDTPEQCLPFYRELLDTGQWPLVRTRFFNAAYTEISVQRIRQGYARTEAVKAGPYADLANPCLTGWNWLDRERCPVVWSNFIDQLCASSQPLISLEGRILRCSYSWSEADFEQNLTELLDYVRQQQHAIAAAGLDQKLSPDLQGLIDFRKDTLTEVSQARLKDQIWAPFAEEFNNFEQQRAQVRGQQLRPAFVEDKKRYLETQTNFDFMSFANQLLNADYRASEAKELLPLMAQYEARIKSDNPAAGASRNVIIRKQMEQRQAKFWINNLEQKLSNIISAPLQTNVAFVKTVPKVIPLPVNSPSHMPAHLPTANQNSVVSSQAEPSPAQSAPVVLDVRHFWPIPLPDGSDDLAPQIASCCYRDGKLWVEVRYDPIGYKGRADFFGVDLRTFESEKAEFHGEDASLPNLIYRKPGAHPFEVDGNYLYLSLGSSIQRYAFKEHAWQQFQVPASGRIQPIRLGDHLYFTSSNSILEYTTDGAFHVLASSRRQPALNLLDKVENYGSPHLFRASDGALVACVQNDIYALTTTNGWVHMVTLPYVDWSRFYPFDDGFVVPVGPASREWWGMFGHLSAPKFLFRQSSPPGIVVHEGAIAQQGNSAGPVWEVPLPGIEFCNQGDSLWFLSGSPKVGADVSGHLQIQKVDGQDVALIRFKAGEEASVVIPIQFTAEATAFTPATVQMLAQPRVEPWKPNWLLEWTPEGLVISRALVPGFWFVPRTDLDRMVKLFYSRQGVPANQPAATPQAKL